MIEAALLEVLSELGGISASKEQKTTLKVFLGGQHVFILPPDWLREEFS